MHPPSDCRSSVIPAELLSSGKKTCASTRTERKDCGPWMMLRYVWERTVADESDFGLSVLRGCSGRGQGEHTATEGLFDRRSEGFRTRVNLGSVFLSWFAVCCLTEGDN